MRLRAESFLLGGEGNCQEWQTIRLDEGQPSTSSSEVKVLSSEVIDVEPGADVIHISARELQAGAVTLSNHWPTSRTAPQRPTGRLDALDEMSDSDFWNLLREARSNAKEDVEWSLRNRLSGLPASDVLAFQAALVAKAGEIVREVSMTWEQAGQTIMRADDGFFAAVLSKAVAPPRAGMSEFEDLTDIAEEVLGSTIDVPEFGTSRSKRRDPELTVPPGILDNPTVRSQSLSVPKWEQLPWRWTTWRVVASISGVMREWLTFANRGWGESIGHLTEKVVADIGIPAGGSILLVENLDPHLSYPKKTMPPVYFFEFDTRMSAEEFQVARGYGRGS